MIVSSQTSLHVEFSRFDTICSVYGENIET